MFEEIIFMVLMILFPIALLALGIQIVIEDNKRKNREEQERMKEAYKQAMREYEEEKQNEN